MMILPCWWTSQLIPIAIKWIFVFHFTEDIKLSHVLGVLISEQVVRDSGETHGIHRII